jgi:hypothetical protein
MAIEEPLDIRATRQTAEREGLAPQTVKRSYRPPCDNLF